jgi:hypothetical protein
MHDLKTLVGSLRTGKRELVLQCDMATLLAGDLTQDSIEQLSTNLLHELVALREHLSVVSDPRAWISLETAVRAEVCHQSRRKGVQLSSWPMTLGLWSSKR